MARIFAIAAVSACAALSVSAPAGAAVVSPFSTLNGQAPIVIGHRGAPAYLPENTIGGNELAAVMGSDYIETDVMMTADKVLVAMHDSTLERTTDVEDFYAPRNGGYAVSDFTYEELQVLTVEPTAPGAETYPGFTPTGDRPYRVPSFADMLDALTAYNEANGTNVGMLTEGKYAYDAETNRAVIETLIEKGYDTPEKSAVQSFDFGNVAEYASLLGEYGVEMGVAQLGGGNLIGDEWYVGDTASFASMSGYLDTVALSYGSITEDLIDAAHGMDLSVYAWTFRPADQAEAASQMQSFLDWGLDGFITDNPDYVLSSIDAYAVAPIPLPAALPLMAGGLAALTAVGRLGRRRKG